MTEDEMVGWHHQLDVHGFEQALGDGMKNSKAWCAAVHHQLPEFVQTHMHSVDDAIQPSHPLSSPSPPAFNLSQPQGLFQ